MPKKKVSKKKQGKKNREAGARFERKIREDLERMGWIVSKWMNTVEQEKNGGIWKLVPAKRKYNPYKRALGIGTGFPDFIAFKGKGISYDVIGVEVKGNGYLTPSERDMCKWLVENKIFQKILIAKKGKKRGEIEYVDFEKKYITQ
jgi:hypothetical protein